MLSDNMDNVSHRAIICYLDLKDVTPKEFHEDTDVKLGETTLSYRMVKKWDAEFKHDRKSLEDDISQGRPVSDTKQDPRHYHSLQTSNGTLHCQ